MSKYVRKADRIDPERGDILQISRDLFAPLYAHNFPEETRYKVLDALVKWFIGGEEQYPDEPLASYPLRTLINAQKNKVRDYLDFCRVQAENKRATTVDHGRPRLTTVGNINKEEEKDNVNKSFSSSVREETGSLKAPPSSLDSVLSRDAALQEIGKIAPPLDNEHYNMEDLQYHEECHEGQEETSIIDELVTDFERSGATNTRKPLEQYLADVGDEMFRRAWFRFDTDVYKAQRAEKPFDNPAGVFLGRLKRLKTALQSLHQ